MLTSCLSVDRVNVKSRFNAIYICLIWILRCIFSLILLVVLIWDQKTNLNVSSCRRSLFAKPFASVTLIPNSSTTYSNSKSLNVFNKLERKNFWFQVLYVKSTVWPSTPINKFSVVMYYYDKVNFQKHIITYKKVFLFPQYLKILSADISHLRNLCGEATIL